MKLTIIRENEDGSADALIEGITVEEQEFFIKRGILAALKDALDKEEALDAELKSHSDDFAI